MAIQFKGSAIAGIKPAPSELVERELAINTNDWKLYTKTPESIPGADDGQIIEIGGNNINTGLETPGNIGGVHDGHRYINGVDADKFGTLGNNATDLSYSGGTLVGIGALAEGSFVAGIDTIARAAAARSFVLGGDSIAEGPSSFIFGTNSVTDIDAGIISIGNSNTTSGTKTLTIGTNNTNGNSIDDGGLVFGNDNNLTVTADILIGKGLVSTGRPSGSIVIGRYNKAAGASDNVFTIGGGDAPGTLLNILSINSTGVLKLDNLGSISSILSDPRNVVTYGLLSDPGTPGVISVNGHKGPVTLETGDIAQGVGGGNGAYGDTLWMTQDEKDRLQAAEIAITQKEPNLPTPNINSIGKALIVTDVALGTYDWRDVTGDNVQLSFTELTDTAASYDGTSGQFLRIDDGNGTDGTSLISEVLGRQSGELKLPVYADPTWDGTYTPYTGAGNAFGAPANTFDLSNNGKRWPMNDETFHAMGNKEESLPGPVTGSVLSSKHKIQFVVTDATQDINDPSQVTTWGITVIDDNAANLSYNGASSGIAGTNVQTAIDEIDTRLDTLAGTSTDLAWSPAAGAGTITNTGGTDAIITQAGLSTAGLLRSVSGTSGQVLTCDGAGAQNWTTPATTPVATAVANITNGTNDAATNESKINELLISLRAAGLLAT